MQPPKWIIAPNPKGAQMNEQKKKDEKKAQQAGPHFATQKPGEFFAVAPGMRFRDKNGNVTVIAQPKKP
jgi:hypothetical protein